MRRATLAAALVAACLTLSGCIGLPDDGPVVEAQTSGTGNRSDAMAINPLGPQPGQSRAQVVKGFLDAMQATPIRYDVAREFLTAASRASWQPRSTIVYDDISVPRPGVRTDVVDVELVGADSVDERGSWQGALDGAGADTPLQFTVVQEGEDYRIANPLDVLIVPQSWYAERFRQVSLFFFDATSQVLVPDPVFVPRGVDLATVLVRRLVAGPAPELRSSARNLLPAGVAPDLTVPVSADGVATVDLTGEDVPMPTLSDRELLVAQLAWTLRQDSSVERIRVLVDGEPVTRPDEPDVSVNAGEAYAPFVADANTLFYGLADGLLVGGGPQSLVPVSGPFGTTDFGLRSITPDLPAARAAGVTADGSAMLVGPVRASDSGAADGVDEGDDVADDAAPDDTAEVETVLSGATDLLTPAWDFSGRLWMVDRRSDGAVVSLLREGTPTEIDVPGVSGQDVKLFLVSRDGSRLVAVIRDDDEDRMVVSRLLTSADGDVTRALPARAVDVEGSLGLRIRDLAWLSPTEVVVLHPIGVGADLFQVRTASVDGAPGGIDDLAVTLDGRVLGLMGTPDPEQDTYAVVRGTDALELVDLSGPTGGAVEVGAGITSLGYVG